MDTVKTQQVQDCKIERKSLQGQKQPKKKFEEKVLSSGIGTCCAKAGQLYQAKDNLINHNSN